MDCIDGMKQIDDNSIDMVLTSPPYDDLRKYNGYKFDINNTVKELYRILKEGGIIVWIIGDSVKGGSETLTSFKQAIIFRENKFYLHDTMIYEKNAFQIKQDIHKFLNICLYLVKENQIQQILKRYQQDYLIVLKIKTLVIELQMD